MIDKQQYVRHKKGAFQYVTSDMVATAHTPEEYENFIKWMRGQTIAFGNDEKTSAIYVWDYERWFRQGCKTEQGKDWD
jgi:hypothetical protein